jgi:hypothetical protein
MKVSAGHFFLVLLSTLALSACSNDDDVRVQCNDPFAENYDPNATDNISCLFPILAKTVTTIAELPATLNEISGLAPYENHLIGHNDRGNPAQLFVINSSNGMLEHTVGVIDAASNDWEDLAWNDEFLFIADVGNNEGDRTDLGIHMLPWNSFNPAEVSVAFASESIFFRYPEQVSFNELEHNFDCEAVFYWDGYLYLFNKHRDNSRSVLYRVPAIPGVEHDAEFLGAFNAGGRITGADINSDGSALALVGFDKGGNCFVWKFTGFERGNFLQSEKLRYIIGPFSQFGQMESVIFENDSTLFIASEEVVELTLPQRLYRMTDF